MVKIECFDIDPTRLEYLNGMIPQLQQKYNPEQLKFMMLLLDDFCNNLKQNGLILIRIESDPIQSPPGFFPDAPSLDVNGEEEFVDDEDNEIATDQEAVKLRAEYEKKMKTIAQEEEVEVVSPMEKIAVERNNELSKPKNFLDKIKKYEVKNLEEEDD